MKIAIYSCKPFERAFLEKASDKKHTLLFLAEALNIDTVPLASGCEAVCIFTNDDASAPVLEKLSLQGVRYIAIRAAGTDQVDLKKAKELSIQVANVPDYSPYSIAEHTVAMILALNRKLIPADKQVRAYDFRLDHLIGFDLNGKTVGIIGLGKIGSIVAKILHGFGCRLIGYDPCPDTSLTVKYGVEFVSLNTLCAKAHIITLHTPLTPSTKYIIQKEQIDLMMPGVMLINTGRGALLNTIDVIEGLAQGKIGYLGLDVYEKEKGLFFMDHSANIPKDALFARLLTLPNVLITGHQAFLTVNALQNIADTTIGTLTEWEQTGSSKHDLILTNQV